MVLAAAALAAFGYTLLLTVAPRAAAAPGARLALAPTSCAVSADVSAPGTGVRVSGFDFKPNQRFTIYLKPQVVAKLTTDAHGGFATTVALPNGLSGPQTLQIEGAGCAVEVTFAASAPSAAPSSATPTSPASPQSSPPAPAVHVPGTPGQSSAGLSNRVAYGLLGLVLAAAVLVFVAAGRLGHRPSANGGAA